MGAIFDPTHTYRYTLWREWNAQAPRVAFIMLNPSTADAEHNDPTIRRCLQFAKAWGFGSLEVVNLFAYRTPYPQVLREVEDPVGLEGDRYLLQAATTASQVILAWGNWGHLHQRDRAVLQLFSQYSHLACLGMNQSGQPRHPLYLKGETVPQPFSINTI